MRRAAIRVLAVCAVLLVPGPRTSSGESTQLLEARPVQSPVLVQPTTPVFPAAVQPPEFLLPRRAAAARPARRRPVSPRPAQGTAARAAQLPAPRPSGVRRSYRVTEGDSLWEIARRFGTTVEAIAAANELSDADFLRPGQVLQVPVGRAAEVASSGPARYTVRPGDTLWAIALKTGVRVEALAAANGIQGDRLRVGQRLVIPVPGSAAARRITPLRTRSTVAYLWPARGVITSRFGMRWRRHHNGVDIAAPRGTPIYAARAGRVVRAGWYGGYGLVVVLDHGDGMETWYGHASRILVRVGQRVERGEAIARVGCTGACTGPHVHFEVRVRGQPVDPLRYLP
ncbi:Murein hydrolase activator NlpD [bacterium HR32]|nr:Murein hydrolase activator NlpD [bacterium HR32]